MNALIRICLAFVFALSAISYGRADEAPAPAKTPLARCLQAPQPASTAREPVSATINPSTRWQPRGGTIVVAVTDPQSAILTTEIIACIGWDTPWDQQADHASGATPAPGLSWRTAHVTVRPAEAADKPYTVNLGIVVPNLDDAPFSGAARVRRVGFGDALGIVPLAHLRLIGLNGQTAVFDAEQTVGITSHWLSYLVAIAVVGLALLVVFRLSKTVLPPKGLGLSGWILDVIKAADGTASLSSLQMLLWTALVIGCAAYVMSLSGTLINITDGTLTLLGIAGASRLVAAYTESKSAMPQMPAAAPPQWPDILRSDKTGAVDITRIQMLLFTLVSAWFVAMQVLTTYVIPDIPPGYQVLMGISNGVYVGRKLIA